MKEVLTYFIQHIVDKPDEVEIKEETVDSQVIFYVSCATGDVGRVIGKKGKIIKALRRLLGILAMRENVHVNISMVNTNGN